MGRGIGVAAVTLAVVAVFPGTLLAGQHASPDAAEAVGICARCHERQTVLAVETGGHAAGLRCEDCHGDRRPGRFGRRHRKVPSCASHHEQTGHPKKRAAQSARKRRRLIRNCITCHEPHGSENASLVRSTVRAPGPRLVPVRFDNQSGAAPGGFTDPTAPGTGICEICHRQTAFYRNDGGGAAHFTGSCVLCHDHRAGFGAGAGGQDCTACHTDQGGRFAKGSLHSTTFQCSDCHEELAATPGPGHRLIPACTECHTTVAAHAPQGIEPFPCTQCHNPHGTDNIKLVLDVITTPQGEDRPIVFDSLAGRADGSFASASVPGSGICEVCHVTTTFYRADGTGLAHFEFSCLGCHRHENGFVLP